MDANLASLAKDGQTVLAQRSMSLENRYPVASVNEVFKDNILLNLAYMDGRVTKREDIKWEDIRKPFRAQFALNPNEVFTFQEDALPVYQGRVVKTTNAHFNFQEGFKTDGYLAGDGVCHLASLIYWAAKDAGLEAYAPANHDFMPVPF